MLMCIMYKTTLHFKSNEMGIYTTDVASGKFKFQRMSDLSLMSSC